MNKVLIFSSLDDAHAAGVNALLLDMGSAVDFFRFDRLNEHSQLNFQADSDESSCLIVTNDNELDLNSYDSIWYRRPGLVKSKAFLEPWIEQMVRQETMSAMDGILRGIDCIWMNYPPNDLACLQKLWQLKLARSIGLDIPKTLVSNDPQRVCDFFTQCHERVVYKMISEMSNFFMPSEESPAGISTLPLRKEDIPFIGQVSHAAHLFQEQLTKRYELRITVVGRQLFSVKIESQSGRGKVDWRHDYSVPMEPYTLPVELRAKCLELMSRLGLNYGAIDFIVTETGEYVFLEINCAGQFKWIENRLDMPITLEVAKLLSGLSPPLVTYRSSFTS